MPKLSILLTGVLAVSFWHEAYAQSIYGATRLVGYVPAATHATVATTQPPTWAPYTFAPYTFAPYTFQPIQRPGQGQYDPNRDRYGGSGASASSHQTQSGRGSQAGGSASASSGSGYDSRYGQRQPSGQVSASGYGGRQPAAPARYDPYAQPRPYDPRQPQRTDPRYTTRAPYRPPYQPPAPVDYSRYPPTVKSLVLSETAIYLWWTDPLIQNSGQRRGQQTPSSSNTKYTVKYSKLSGQDASEQTEEVASKDLHLKSLEPGTDYRFSVKINRDGQETGWSAPIVNRTLEQLPLAPPSNIKVEPTDRDATITISPPEGFQGSIRSYIFLYAPSGGNGGSEERKWQEIQIPGGYAGAPDARQVLPRLIPGEEYFYTVQAVNSRGSSPFSEIQSFKTLSGPVYKPRPLPPYDPYGPRPDDRGVPSPYDNEGDSGYEEQPPTPESAHEGDSLPDHYGEEVATAQPGSDDNTPDYYGRYQTTEDPYAPAQDQNAGDDQQVTEQSSDDQSTDSQWSPYWEAATEPSNPPAEGQEGQDAAAGNGQTEPPTDLKIEALEDPADAIVSFTASPSSGITEYEVLYTYDPTVSDDLWQVETVPSGESQAILARLSPNTRVHVKVRAKSSNGDSAYSETVTLTPGSAGDPQAPDAHQDADPAAADGSQAQG